MEMLRSFFLEPLWGILIFTVVLYIIAILNVVSLKRLSGYGDPSRFPFVSILIPARNEALNIEACLQSLLAQQYIPFEVLVLDDDSEDGTAEILERAARDVPRLEVFAGKPLPQGWAGKQWACHQLSARAKGELLLFTDADTRHHPQMLANAVAAMEEKQLGFISGLPHQKVLTIGETLLLPMLAWVILTLLPLPLARHLRMPSMAVGVGQFLLFNRKAYEEIGGHAAVRNTSLEDVAFARLLKRRGIRWSFLDLGGRVECRMYRGLKEGLQGIGKNLIAFFEGRLLFMLFAWSWISYLSWYPILVLLAGARGAENPINRLALLNVILLFGLWGLVNLRFRFPLWQALFHPITAVLYLFMAVKAFVWRLAGKSESWKGRELPREAGR
jgi:chlorobactene glucosyltransferase